MISDEREWTGRISPSSAGNGPRLIFLKATKPYSITADGRAFAALGVGVHGKLSYKRYTEYVLAETKLSDDAITGIADVLEPDEQKPGQYVLQDYKTWGSYKVARALGYQSAKVPVVDPDGNPVLLKTGKNKGQQKYETQHSVDPKNADLKDTAYQVNRYRILFEHYGYPVSRMQVQAIVRDGGTFVAQQRGIDKNIYIIDIPFIPDAQVLMYYRLLQDEVDAAFKTGKVRKCDTWESWDGRRCTGFCEVADHCKEMEEQAHG